MDALSLLRLLEQHPDEPALRAMYIDAAMDEHGYSLESATEMADQTVRLGRSARDLARATHLMRPDSQAREYLHSIILRCLDRPPPPGTMCVTTLGDHPPHWSHSGSRGLGRGRPRRAVYVGAQWVCQQWDARLAELERRRQRDALIPRPQ
jgi:hypothetical protein